jgi:hypothetical protein
MLRAPAITSGARDFAPALSSFDDENGHDRGESNRHLDKQGNMSTFTTLKMYRT